MLKDELLRRYGPLMALHDVAEVLHVSKAGLRNKVFRGTLEFPMFKIGGRLMAETSDVCNYIEEAKVVSAVSNG